LTGISLFWNGSDTSVKAGRLFTENSRFVMKQTAPVRSGKNEEIVWLLTGRLNGWTFILPLKKNGQIEIFLWIN
jgi:hypothetical protein